MSELCIIELTARGCALPYDPKIYGFDPDWWIDGCVLEGHQYFSFTESGEEIARAETTPTSSAAATYTNLSLPDSVVGLNFFEVREDYRGAQWGTRSIALLRSHYRGHWLMAASTNVGAFWSRIGWVHGDDEGKPGMPSFHYFSEPDSQTALETSLYSRGLSEPERP